MLGGQIRFRWLGVGGIELSSDEEVVAVDPFFSRPPFRRVWFGRVVPDRSLVAARLPRCDFVLLTHSYWDHLMDVPEVVRSTGALALGSRNSCRLLSILGVAGEQLHWIHANDDLPLGAFRVQVMEASQGTVLDRPIFSDLLPNDLRPSLQVRDYRRDVNFSFLINAGGYRMLLWNSENPEAATRAELLLVGPQRKRGYYDALMRQVRPHVVIPIHWDDLFRPMFSPVHPMFASLAPTVPTSRPLNLAEFKHTLHQVAPTAKLFLPDVFRSYSLDHLA